jgi:hypothetical protein
MRVNAVRHDDPSLIERVEEAGAAEALSNTHVEHEPTRGVPPEQSELF